MIVTISDEAYKQLKKLNKIEQKRILKYLNDLESIENPKSKGKELTGNLKGYWRYRVGDYRIICTIKKLELEITALKIGHRKEIYRF